MWKSNFSFSHSLTLLLPIFFVFDKANDEIAKKWRKQFSHDLMKNGFLMDIMFIILS